MIRKLEKNDIDVIMQIWVNENIKAHSFISKEYWKNNYNYDKKTSTKKSITKTRI